MQESSIFDSDTPARQILSNRPGSFAVIGAASVLAILIIGAIILFVSLPDANQFNDRVEQIFVENDALNSPGEVKLLEILAQSGSAFSQVLASYRLIIFVLLLFAAALLVSAFVFLLNNISLARRMSEIERSGIHINSLLLSRQENMVYINNMEFELTQSACEALSVLCEARLDDEVITGVDIESMISGKNKIDCDEAAGATRIKRLRDQLGNQIVSQLIIKNISRKGYMLSINKDVIRML